MPEKLSKLSRSRLMGRVRSKNTVPEIQVRQLLHKLGFRFRLHKKDLPGKPDLVLAKYRMCIFVHGCFWHQHPNCKRASKPTNNAEFWGQKLNKNTMRDKENLSALQKLGWNVFVIWECETKDLIELQQKLRNIFELE